MKTKARTLRRLVAVAILATISFWTAPALALDVVASTPDLAAVAKAIGGDDLDVTALSKPNEDPHYVDPRPNLILRLNKAELLITVGLELEDAWLVPLVEQARNRVIALGGRGRIVASEHVDLLGIPKGKVDRAEGHIHPGGNPHFYFDPRRMSSVAIAMRDRLKELDPDNADAYETRAREFLRQNQMLMIAQRNKFERLSQQKREVVTYHTSLIYLLDWLSLDEVETIEPKPGIPPNPKHVARVLKRMKKDGVGVIIQEEFYPRKTADTLAKLAKAQVVVIEGGTRFEDGETYIEHIQHITEELYAALSR